MLNFILANNLILLNEGTKPTFRNAIRQEVLDITFVSSNLAGSIQEWHVSDIENFSDHMYLDFKINFKKLSEREG